MFSCSSNGGNYDFFFILAASRAGEILIVLHKNKKALYLNPVQKLQVFLYSLIYVEELLRLIFLAHLTGFLRRLNAITGFD